MRSIIFGLSVLLSALPFAAAHGYVHALTIDGTRYRGNAPNRNNAESPIRTINTANPVKGANNRAVNCGPGARPAALVAEARPGSTLEFDWGDWPHNTGPLLTYLASCGDTPCDQFDAINARWFKIDQTGKRNGGSGWVQQDIMNGQSYRTTLPNNLASGQYLVRHEIIALHIAQGEGGAEFYPSCAQINVVGDGTATPSPDELVSLPGAYSDSDPGIRVNAFNNAEYNFPGPRVATLSNNGGNSGGNSGSNNGGSNGSNNSSSRSGGRSSTSGSSSSSTQDGAPAPTRTRVAAVETNTVDDASQDGSSQDAVTSAPNDSSATPTPADASPSTKKKPCKRKSTEIADPQVITSFAETKTFDLRALPTDVDSYYGPSGNTLNVRPHRVSRVMRSLIKPH